MPSKQALSKVPDSVWKPDWVINGRHVGNGKNAPKYLAQYVFRVAIAPSRIIEVTNTHVTFRYQRSGEKKWRECELEIFVDLLPEKQPQRKPWTCKTCGGLIRWREFIPVPRGCG